MAARFPNELDTNLYPTSGSKLNQIPHAELHNSASKQLEAIQERIGITSSAVPTSIDYELHNISHGHDHDGINSRPVSLGPDTNGSFIYVSGTLSLSSSTRLGYFADKVNRKLLNLEISSSLFSSSANSIAFESQGVELTPTAIRVNFSGPGISGSASGNNVQYDVEHERRELTHLVNCGPFEGWVTSSMYHEFIYPSGAIKLMPTASIWYESSNKIKKLFETQWVRNNRMQATKILYKAYKIDGATVKTTAVDLITYSGPFEVNRTRTII